MLVRPAWSAAVLAATAVLGMSTSSAVAQTAPPASVPTTVVPSLPTTTVPTTTVPPSPAPTTDPRPVAVPEPDGVGSPDPSITADQVRAGIELGRLTDRIQSVTVSYEAARADLDRLQREVDHVSEQIAGVEADVARLRERIQARVRAVYRQSGSGSLAALDVADRRDFGSGRVYADATVAVDRREVERLAGLESDLVGQRARRADLRSGLEEATNALATERQRLERLRDDESSYLDQWGNLTIIGPPVLTGPEIAAWFESTGVRPTLPDGTTIAEIAQTFVEEGRIHSVRGDVAFAQTIIETGSFTEYSYNNFSGIGWCDSCTTGHRFDTPRDGVRAQIQLLRDYADVGGRAEDIPVPLAPELFGSDPALAAQHYDTFFLKGKVVFWSQMGGGNWATDPFYAGKVLGVYARMLAFAARHGR